MRPLVMDIETGPRPVAEIEPLLPILVPPANYKDSMKIEAYLRERRNQQLAEAALSALTGRVLVVGFMREDGAPTFIALEDERQLLRETWRVIECKRANEKVVTFCGHRFDLPFLARRSWALDVPVPVWFPNDGRFPKHSFLDLAEQWAIGDRSETISLDRLARYLGLPGKPTSGGALAQLWIADRGKALEYLANDLRLTLQIYRRMFAATSDGLVSDSVSEPTLRVS